MPVAGEGADDRPWPRKGKGKKKKERNIKKFKILLIKRNFILLPNVFLFFFYSKNRNFGQLPNTFKRLEIVLEYKK